MDTGIICFTMNGFVLAEKIAHLLVRQGHNVSVFAKSRYLKEVSAQQVKEPLQQWAKECSRRKEAVVFIGASGICSARSRTVGRRTKNMIRPSSCWMSRGNTVFRCCPVIWAAPTSLPVRSVRDSARLRY